MEAVDKKKLDFYTFVRRKISEKEAELRQKKYSQFLIQSKVYDLTQIQSTNFLYKVGVDASGNAVIFLLGYLFPTEKKKIEQAFYYFIYLMDDLVDEPYTIVYFHNGVSAFEKRAINFLKEAYKDLPVKYFLNFNNFIVIGLPWIIRWDIEYGFNNILRFFKRIIFYANNVEHLESLQLIPNEYLMSIPDFQSPDKNISSKAMKQSLLGRNLSEYYLADSGIPYIFIALALYFEEKDRILTEGIFRKAAGASDVQKLITNIEDGNFEAIFQVKDPLIIADVFKKLLKNLAQPLFPVESYKELLKLEVIPEEQLTDFFKDIIKEIPAFNLRVLNFLLQFFRKVNEFKEKNLMTFKNIAICITPCILRSMETSSERSNANLHKEIAKSFVLVNCIQKMLELYDELFEKVEDLRPDIEYVFKRKTLVIQEMKQFARFEEEKMFLSCSHKKI